MEPTTHKPEPGSSPVGRVYLVGAGPGDPGLLTLHGRECLRQAEVVLYDRLACEELLAMAPPEAELIGVGKAPGAHQATQEEINALLVEKARAGRVVVRLKGGDPFLLGRGGEEALALQAEGLACEVVPGVSSAFAAPEMAGIPVTHRGRATSLAVVTGHEAEGTAGSVDWERLAGTVDTIVILMGVANWPSIQDRLLQGGLPPDTPVAFVERGTTPQQRSLYTTLGVAAAEGQAWGLSSPAVIVVGKVAELGPALNWFERLPLKGKTILVPRPEAQAQELSARLRRLGALPVVIPAIEIVPPTDFGPLDRLLGEISGADWLVFTSSNAVSAVLERLWDLGRDVRALAGPKIAAIGQRTARTLEERGLRVELIPAESTSEGLARELVQLGVRGKAIALPLSAQSADVLARELKKAGAHVRAASAYQTRPALDDAERLRALVDSGRLDAVVFTSASCVQSFVLTTGHQGVAALCNGVISACMGPFTAEAARASGFEPTIVAGEASAAGLAQALVQAFEDKTELEVR